MPLSQNLPNFYYEKKFWHVKPANKRATCLPRESPKATFTGWKKGFEYVVGVDEVGRGAWAGPIVTAACAFVPQIKNLKFKIENLGINDSKLLKPKQREKLAKEIKKNALAWDVTEVGVGVINRIGIGRATQKAMRKSIGDVIKKLRNEEIKHKKNSLNILISQYPNIFILVDFYSIPYLRGLGRKNQLGIKNGDQKSISIASASILAKVHRDKIMRSLSKKYPQYGWGKNKGYGTKLQQKAILRYGLTRYHRKEFVKTFLENRRTVSRKGFGLSS
ncbi:MAG: ribonuclease HII [Patescibacteria group bacterium]